MSEPGALAYTAGPSVALVAPGAALLFAQAPTGQTVARCWPLIRDRAGVDVIVEALMADGMAALPGFALVCTDGTGAGVVVRSPGRAVTLDADGGIREVDADALVTWLEIRLDATVAAVTIGVTADLPSPAVVPAGFPVVGGTVLAGSVTMSLAGAGDAVQTPVAAVLTSSPLSTPEAEVAEAAPAEEVTPPAPGLPPEPVLPPRPVMSPEPVDVAAPFAAAAMTANEPVELPRTAGPGLPASPLSVTVQAVACPYGHIGPTYEPYCRLCGTAIEDTRPFLAERPPLGLLRLSTGDVVPLDRGVVMGRNPRAVDELDSGRPHLVRLPSPDNDVSRNHVEVRLADWHVLVLDLGSTNGTTVTIPGQAPIRLRAHEPVPIEPNTEVNLADEIVFRYEVPTA